MGGMEILNAWGRTMWRSRWKPRADRVGRLVSPQDGQNGAADDFGDVARRVERARPGAPRTRGRAEAARREQLAHLGCGHGPGPPLTAKPRRGEEGVRPPTESHGDGARPCGRSGACAGRTTTAAAKATRAKSPKAAPAPTLSNHGTTVTQFRDGQQVEDLDRARDQRQRDRVPRYQKRMITSTGCSEGLHVERCSLADEPVRRRARHADEDPEDRPMAIEDRDDRVLNTDDRRVEEALRRAEVGVGDCEPRRGAGSRSCRARSGSPRCFRL